MSKAFSEDNKSEFIAENKSEQGWAPFPNVPCNNNGGPQLKETGKEIKYRPIMYRLK